MALRPSSVPQGVLLPEPPASSLPHVPDPESDLARAASPSVTRLLTTVVTDPDLESTVAFALVIELVDFAARSRLDYVTSLVTESESVCPQSVGGEPALSNPDTLDIPTPRSYAEAIAGEYSSQWQTALDTEMASWKSTGPYVDEVPPPGANTVDGTWIFRVKRPPGSPPAFKTQYVARGFTQRDYELHSLDFSTAFLQSSLHEEIWLRRPPGFTGSFPAGTQWSLRTTLAGLGFPPSSADPSLFLRIDTTLPPFFVLVRDTPALTWVLQRFDFQFSLLQPTPLSTGHSLSAPPSDESVEPSGPYPELVGCLIYLMTCTRPDLAYPLSLLARYVAPGFGDHQRFCTALGLVLTLPHLLVA
ncbi:unnamed protein product [Closterium sp. NIES-54]